MESYQALNWLLWVTALTAVMWMPYILHLMVREGIFGAMKNPEDFKTEAPAWAKRSKDAHGNAVENLVLMATLVIAAQIVIPGNEVVITATVIYFYARLLHYIVFTAGIPVARTLTFLTGFACQVAVILQLLGTGA